MSKELDRVWHALANRTRRDILDLLRERARSTGEIAAGTRELSRFAVMQHLGVLERAELVVTRRVGRQKLNFLNPVPIQRIYERWVSQYEGAWSEALVSLKRTIETPRRAGRSNIGRSPP